MENASKALLIAAAIIIAVVLISLGVMVLNNGSELVRRGSDTSELDMTSFNNKFSKYTGKIKGAQVNSLLEEIATSNIANKEDQTKKISVSVTATNWSSSTNKPTGYIENVTNKALIGQTYNVTFTKNTQGFISSCTISQ